MPSVFTRILSGELPGRVVYEDEQCAALLSASPLNPGHTLVVPRKEVDSWTDLDPELAAHLIKVAQTIGKALERGFSPEKVGVSIIGLEVRHVHIHLVPICKGEEMDFSRQDKNPRPEDLDAAAEVVRRALEELGQ